MTNDKIIESHLIDRFERLVGMIMNNGRSYTPDERRDIENFAANLYYEFKDSPDADLWRDSNG